MRISNERGIAMITTLLVLMLISALLVGFTTMVVSDQRFRFIDRDRGQAFYAASGGVEKLTTDLGNTFLSNIAPTGAQVAALVATTSVPTITGVTYTSVTTPAPLPGSSLNSCPTWPPKTIGANGYNLTFCADAAGNPTNIASNTILVGPYAGLTALQTPYQIDVTAKTSTGGEVHLSRTIEASAIPVFQFGTFSDVDLSFFAGSNFNFGGRVHTNGNLFLSQGGGTLTLSGKVTAVKEVIRQRLQNGVSIDTGPATHTATVSMASSSTSFRNLDRTEGSVVDGVGSALNDPIWQNVSLSAYNSWIRNGRTGAKALNLPLLTVGGSNPDLIRRPPVGENMTNPVLYNERLFSKASLRILLSDTAADITNLPTVTATAPISLGTTVADSNWNTAPPAAITAPPVTVPAGVQAPIARTPGPLPATFKTNGATAAGWTSLNVSGLPPSFQTTTLSITRAGVTRTVNCTGMTATTFTGCVNPGTGAAWNTGAWASPLVVTTAALAVNFTTATANTTANWANNSTTITVDKTAPFAQTWFFLTPTGATSQILVQCLGYTATTVTGCAASNGAASLPAVASNTVLYTDALSAAQTGTIGGFIKIERQDPNGVWFDVTAEILSYGIAAKNQTGSICADPTPAAILRLQRLRDNGGVDAAVPANGGGCNYAGSKNASDYWPNSLFDTREGLLRDTAPANGQIYINGVMYYIALDVQNLAKWFTTAAPYAAGTGANSKKDTGGFTVYFSDRRNNRNALSVETGELGWEDFVNPNNAATGTPNNILDAGEDVNANGTLEVYGGQPSYNGAYNTAPPGAVAPLDTTASFNPPFQLASPGFAMVNRSIFFRHALKLINGNNISGLGVTGLTVVAENPVYVQGDWNSQDGAASDFNGVSAATAVIADAVTLLSNGWTDYNSYVNPYVMTNRNRGTQTWYRMAIIGGKNSAFPWINYAGAPSDFGTDGGAHNFLRFLENGDQTVNYMGATATFFYSRQAVGTFKCCTTVYGAPTRNYSFDINFNNPALLPPNTPVFRDMNAVGFSQELRPGK
jgi:hypothetical protein